MSRLSFGNSQENMVAEPVPPAPAAHGEPASDPTTCAGGAAPAAPAMPPGVDAAACGPREVHEMSSGLSEIHTVSDLSAFSTPHKARRRGADEMSGTSGMSSLAGSRPPSPAPAARLVHRRVEPASDTYPGRLKQLDDQQEADREMIGYLREALIELQGKVSSHDSALAKLRRNDDVAAKNVLGIEAAILKRIDDTKNFIVKDQEDKLGQMRTHVLGGLKAELTNKELFGKHLIGHDSPVLQPLVDGILHEKFSDIDKKFALLNAWVASRTQRDGKVESYLQELDKARPQEGKTVETAFMSVAQELLEIRAAANTAAGAQQAGSAGGGGGGGGGGSGVNRAAFEELCGQVTFIRENIMQGKCHCVHVDEHEARVTGVETQQRATDNSLEILAAAVRQAQRPAPEPATAPARATSGSGSCGAAGPCGPCGSDPWASYSSPGLRSGPASTHGPAGGGSGGAPWFAAEICGGNGVCHCIHVKTLQDDVEELKARVDGACDPWADGTVGAQYGPGGRQPRARAEPLPLVLGPLGQLYDPHAKLFDDKLANQSNFQFDGSKGGAAWKGKVERYFISKCPALMKMLSWAEKWEGEEITQELLIRATQGTLMDYDRLDNVNGAIWGFISNCISGEIETVFKTADTLQGFEAWRRVIRYIEHGKDIKLEGMRNEMKTLHLRPIRSLEQVPIGISEFELKIKEYIDVGGTSPTESEMKADLLHILPESLRDNLLWRATDPGPYSRFRDMVRSQAARTLLNRQRLPVHAVGDSASAVSFDANDSERSNPNGAEDLMALLKKLGGRNGDDANDDLAAILRKFGERSNGGRPPREQSAPRGPRKCANCGKEHKELRCPHPRVDVKDRTCWECGGKFHLAKDCPQKGKGGKPIRLVDEGGLQAALQRLATVSYAADGEGFARAKKTCKPVPSVATVGDFVHSNSFAALSQRERREARRAAHQTGIEQELQEVTTRGYDHVARDTQSRWRGTPDTRHPPADGGTRACARDDGSASHLRSGTRSCMPPDGAASSRTPLSVRPPSVQGATSHGADAKEINIEMDEDTHKLATMLEQMQHEPRASLAGPRPSDGATLGVLEHGQMIGDELLVAAPDEVRIKVAADTGAVDNVVRPADLPGSVHVTPNSTGRHFVGASNEHIENYGSCDTVLQSEHGQVACEWKVADVSRALHSISKVAGPAEGPGDHDVLFNNRVGVVVPPGIVDTVLKYVKPLMQYDREGGLYVAEVTMSGFARPGLGQ